jgi:hypothetical protein
MRPVAILLSLYTVCAVTDKSINEASLLAACPKLDNTGKPVVTIEKMAVCITTTPTSCSAECSAILKEANGMASCFPEVARIALAYGISKSNICYWRAPCGINQLKGISCSKPNPSPNIRAVLKIVMPAREATLDTAEKLNNFTLAMAEVLKQPWGNIKAFFRTKAIGRALATTGLAVEIGVQNTTEGTAVLADIQSPSFGTQMSTELQSSGFDTSGMDFTPSEVSPAVAIPPMGGYVVPNYAPSDAVATLHGYSPMTAGQTWDADPNSAKGKKYLEGVAKLVALAVVISVLAIIEYFIFLCGHNCSCCKRCCKCCNQKKSWGGSCGGRGLLLWMFFMTMVLMCTSIQGRDHFQVARLCCCRSFCCYCYYCC